MMKRRMMAASVAAALLLTACGGDNGAAEDPDTIILGLVPSQEVDQLVEDASVLSELLSAELGMPVEAVITDSYTALVEAMNVGQAHIGMFGPIALVQAADRAGAEPILQSIRRGAASYHTQWFTNDPDRFCLDEPQLLENPEGNEFMYCNGIRPERGAEGPMGEDALENIQQGETIFFVDGASASGYYYPATQVETAAGLDPFTDIDAQFGGSHPNAVLAVARGDAALGVSFDDARNNLVEEDPQIGEKVIVFAWSSEIPNDGVAVAGNLSDELKAAIKAAFEAVMATEEGAAAFDAVYSIEGFQDADLAALDVARQVEANFGD